MDKNLNSEQLEAINFKNGPLLIIAGAGTGKTTVITERIKHLILDENIDPESLLALTFTEKAASEMQERVDIALPYGYSQMWIDTFHGFCEKILKDEALNIGLDSTFKLLTEPEAILFFRRNFDKFDFNYFRPLGSANKLISSLLFHFSRLKDEDISTEEYLNWANKQYENFDKANNEEKEEIIKYLELANLYKTYEDLKNKNSVMDFSDLVYQVVKLFRTRKHILKKYKEKFKYILVDEFQDTNFLQNQLILLLTNENKNINVVGDDDQAIYRWRGAAVSNMLSFRDNFPNSKIVTLIKNYRSTQEILDKSYDLIRYNNPDRLEVKENINKKLLSERKLKGDQIKLISTTSGNQEVETVVNEIIKVKKSKRYNFSDFAILVRANDHALPFIKELQLNNIPYQFLGNQQLFNQEEIKDLIAFLKVIVNPHDSTSLFRILEIKNFNILNLTQVILMNFAKRKNLTLFETLINLNEVSTIEDTQKENLKKIYNLIKDNLEKLRTTTPGQILYFFLKETGILNTYLNSKDISTQTKAQNTARFFQKIKTFEDTHQNSTASELLEWVDLSMQSGEGPTTEEMIEERDAVNILTVHASKGLEFPVVFIVNLVNNRFPSTAKAESIPIPPELIKEALPTGNYHLEEERRLFYVAMTRSQDILYFTYSKFYNEGKRERKISPFIIETLGREKIEELTTDKKQNKNQLTLLDFDLEKKDVKLKISEKISIPYISYSQIQTFDFCPLHYKLKYILKIPTTPTQSQSFGTSLHNTLRDFYLLIENKKKKEEINIDELFNKNWIRDGYLHKKDENKFYDQGLLIIKNYLDENFRDYIKSSVETPFKFFINKLCVGGIIDRIDLLPDGTVEIIDYKTGSNVPDEKKLAKNLQLTIYALALQNSKILNLNNIDPEKVKLSLYYLEKNKKLTITKSKEQLEVAKTDILEKVSEIENSNFECKGDLFCKDCEYKMLCKTT